ncbi:MAG: class I SAM-dependent methyltransferase [Bacteroidales bacterium]|nr:class I SAM-dependent methyltransferase [Bacteroidales bacterium]
MANQHNKTAQTPQNLAPNFAAYELIDSGGGEKLERFGTQIISRPEPQAIWPKAMPQSQWDALAVARFEKGAGDKSSRHADEWGRWVLKPQAQQQWHITYDGLSRPLTMRLGLTSFKHVGIFPEQAANWDFVYDAVSAIGSSARVLNLFAYTGGASLAAAAAGASVTHVDAVRPVVTWARENMETSGLEGVRWIVDDAQKFVGREVRRGSRYNGIVLDPPAYGRGPDGEKWLIERHLYALLEQCAQLLTTDAPGFVVLNLYSLGYSPIIAKNMINSAFGASQWVDYGELFVTDAAKRSLPLGVYARTKTNC